MLARPQSKVFSAEKGLRVDSVNFQPCPRARTQDRYAVKELDVYGRKWSLTGVFDGHLGETTVDHVQYHLPRIVSEFLHAAFKDDPMMPITPSFISDLLSRSIIAFDDAIAGDVLSLFPGGLEGLSKMTDQEISAIINDQHTGGSNYKKARLCMYGTTALVVLVDPDHQNMWVANVGDCQALIVSPDPGGSGEGDSNWRVELLTRDHNGDNDAEVTRVRREHPGEPDCVTDGRVLGALAPFRSLGDVPFKQPPEFSRRILYNLLPGFHDTSPWEEFLVKNLTPPYISAIPDIIHRSLPIKAPPPASSRPSMSHESSALCLPIFSSLFTGLFKGSAGRNSASRDSDTNRPAAPPPTPNEEQKILEEDPSSESKRSSSYLIIASDGFADLCYKKGQTHHLLNWAKGLSKIGSNHPSPIANGGSSLRNRPSDVMSVNSTSEKVPGSPTSSVASRSFSVSSRRSTTLDDGPRGKGNLALRLLREVLGGDDSTKLSQVLTLDMNESWIDDTTITVQTL